MVHGVVQRGCGLWAGRVIWVLPPKPPISLIGDKLGSAWGFVWGYARLQCFTRLYFTPAMWSGTLNTLVAEMLR